MSKAHDRLLASPRRMVRFIYVRDAWPDMPKDIDPVEAIMSAPDAVVIAALTREVETYGEVIQEERKRADAAEAELDQLRQAARTVVEFITTKESP